MINNNAPITIAAQRLIEFRKITPSLFTNTHYITRKSLVLAYNDESERNKCIVFFVFISLRVMISYNTCNTGDNFKILTR